MGQFGVNEVSENATFWGTPFGLVGKHKRVYEDLWLLRKFDANLSFCRAYLSGMEEDDALNETTSPVER